MDGKGLLKTSYTKEDIESFLIECSGEREILPIYLEKIRNLEPLSQETIEKIRRFDDDAKLKIIAEYNSMMKYLITFIEDVKDHSSVR
uniref:Uncharacterized protein n=1 Tax=viral metagenome TaxID=1070528 RepID=A0A6C0DX72_9ZZZZ